MFQALCRGFLRDNCGLRMAGAGFGNAARANTVRANAQLFLHALHNRANSLQIWIPAPSPRVIRVADDVSVLRTLAADFTLLSHNHSILDINANKHQ
jgi:hypothetical protein